MNEDRLILPELTPSDQEKVRKFVADEHKKHSHALWRTRISVSFLTALITSALISIPVTITLRDDNNNTNRYNAVVNCQNIKKVSDVNKKILIRAKAASDAQFKKSGQIQQEKQANEFYNWAIGQYNSVRNCKHA